MGGARVNETSGESKWVQQHLANERTFLAWIRTSITIVGLGFLAAGIVFRSTPYSHFGDGLAAVVGISAVLLGGIVMALATNEYLKKRKGINNEQFQSTHTLVWIIFGSLGIIEMLLIALVVLLLLYD
jgi:putative membrane protein